MGGGTGICRGEIRCELMDESTGRAMKPHVVLKESQKKGREGGRESKKRNEEVEGEMYTDL